MAEKPLRILSLGAGVQSSTLAMMAATGAIDPIDAAIFADTQNEPGSVMRWLDALEGYIATAPRPFPVYRVTLGNLLDEMLHIRTSRKTGNRYLRTLIPAFVDKGNGKTGLFGRRCTASYKLALLRKTRRRLAKIPRACEEHRIDVLIGISLDEYHRMKPAKDAYERNIFPLVDMRMTRFDCLNWMARNGYPQPPKSSCVFCPLHSDATWKQLRDFEPEEFAEACRVDETLRILARQQTGTARAQGDLYLHGSCKPLAEVDFGAIRDPAQGDFFGNDCTGLCGV